MKKRTPSRASVWAALLIILALATALRVHGFRGFGAVDDAAYARIGYEMAHGRYVPGQYEGPAVFPLRVGILYPTGLLFRAFGVNEWTMVSFPFVLSLASILLVFAVTRHFFDVRAGLVASAIWAVLPLDVFHASILVPDLAAAFFAGVGVLAILAGIRRKEASSQALLLCGLIGGLSFGMSWLCKETVVYLAPFCLVLLAGGLWRAPRPSAALWTGVFIGSAGVLLAEMAVYYSVTGDWLFHMSETERNYRQYPNAFFIEGSRLTGNADSYMKAVLRRVLLTGPLTIFLNTQFAYIPLVALGAMVYGLLRRDAAFLLPGLWFVTLAVMFNFASSSLREYVPLVLFDRYLYPVMLPAVVLVAGMLSGLWQSGRQGHLVLWLSRTAALAAVAIIAVSALQRNRMNASFAPGWVVESRALSAQLTPRHRIHTDILSIYGLEFFWKYPASTNLINFEGTPDFPEVRPGDYVLLNQSYLEWLRAKGGWWPTENAVYREPAFARQPPRQWEPIWREGNAVLYHVQPATINGE